MKKILFLFLIVILLATGCEQNKRITLPEADIVFQTIIDRKDVIGFYTLENEQKIIVDILMPLQFPIRLGTDKFAGNVKRGFPGYPTDYTGSLVILNGQTLTDLCSKQSLGGSLLQKFNGKDIILDSYNGLLQINGNDCSIKNTLLTQVDIDTISNRSNINSFSLSRNGDLLIISLWGVDLFSNKLFGVNLPSKTFTDYDIVGVYPSISPDQRQAIYLGIDGIHIMDINGDNNKLIVHYNPTGFSSGSLFDRGVNPKPVWSSDGQTILYHKCNQPANKGCEYIDDYEIYIYDFRIGTEKMIISGGINPSWYSE